jgi:hypothetical protein
MRGAVISTPPYDFMACCLIKCRENLSFIPTYIYIPREPQLLALSSKLHFRQVRGVRTRQRTSLGKQVGYKVLSALCVLGCDEGSLQMEAPLKRLRSTRLYGVTSQKTEFFTVTTRAGRPRGRSSSPGTVKNFFLFSTFSRLALGVYPTSFPIFPMGTGG